MSGERAYVSTRGQAGAVGFTEAILAGLAPDGGLYVPEAWPAPLAGPSADARYGETARATLAALSGGEASHADACEGAYHAGQWPDAVTPLVQVGAGLWALELFHGPSLSFKDVAMQLIAPLYEAALAARDRRLTVVCATSGDTGGAAVEALKTSGRIDLFVLLPKGRVSEVQRRFMTGSGADNVHALEIEGDFDACQALVKGLFADQAFVEGASLSGVNSINFARIAAQSVYYRIAAHALAGQGPVEFVAPTGNFGDALSGWVAKMLGAPIGRIISGVNANDSLAQALATGQVRRGQGSFATLSPAMDIQVASNFERLVFEACGRDGETTRRLYEDFAQAGAFDLPAEALARMRAEISAVSISDADTQATMAALWRGGRGYLACPHTAVGFAAAARTPREPNAGARVVLATAHPAKFPETIALATGEQPALPAHCADLFDRRERLEPLRDDLATLKSLIKERSRAWKQN